MAAMRPIPVVEPSSTMSQKQSFSSSRLVVDDGARSRRDQRAYPLTWISGQEGWSQADYDSFGFLFGEPPY